MGHGGPYSFLAAHAHACKRMPANAMFYTHQQLYKPGQASSPSTLPT